MAPGVTYASDDPNLPTQEELTIFIVGDLHHLITVGNKDSMETHWPIHNLFFFPKNWERNPNPALFCVKK